MTAIREKAAGPVRNAVAADRTAVAAFYADRSAPIWVTPNGFTPRARHAMAEIAKADDWGLEARAFDLPQLPSGSPPVPALADAEVALSLAVLKYARHARGGRLDPTQISRNIDQKPPLRDPKEVMDTVATTDAPGDYLRNLHPKHPQFQLLRQALLKARGESSQPQETNEATGRIPNGPTLKLGMRHPDVALLRRRLELSGGSEEELYDKDVQDAVKAFQRKSGLQASGSLNNSTRSALSGGSGTPPSRGSDVQRIVLNMERWRWMPEHLGQFYVWNNVPEFQSRVLKNGRMVHQTKIVVGKPDTPTAIFSADMRYIVFGPEWGVPDSIKVKEILPYLRPSSDGLFGWGGGTDTRVLERHNLRVIYNGRPVNASQVDWQRVDIRRFTFIQPPGPSNVLGAIKFRFPNRHDIYMHDTPQRNLFEQSNRAFSHGCMRTQNPQRLAEILLEEDKGWSAGHVRELYARGGNNEVTLTKHIPVHTTYFTATVGEDGRLQTFGDLYGHDQRLASALAGRPMALEEPSVASGPAPREREARRGRVKQSNNDFFSGLFGN